MVIELQSACDLHKLSFFFNDPVEQLEVLMSVTTLALLVSKVDLMKFFHEELKRVLSQIILEVARDFDQIVPEGEPDAQLFIEASKLDKIPVMALITCFSVILELRIKFIFNRNCLCEGQQSILDDQLSVFIAVVIIFNLSINVVNFDCDLLL